MSNHQKTLNLYAQLYNLNNSADNVLKIEQPFSEAKIENRNHIILKTYYFCRNPEFQEMLFAYECSYFAIPFDGNLKTLHENIQSIFKENKNTSFPV